MAAPRSRTLSGASANPCAQGGDLAVRIQDAPEGRTERGVRTPDARTLTIPNDTPAGTLVARGRIRKATPTPKATPKLAKPKAQDPDTFKPTAANVRPGIRRCNYPGHVGRNGKPLAADSPARDLPATSEYYFIRKSGSQAGKAVDICLACCKLRAQAYGQEVKAAKDAAADIRLTPLQRKTLADLPEPDGRNRRLYVRLVDLGLVVVGDDRVTRTQTGSQALKLGAQS